MRAILSHPYSNALFWWFDNLEGGYGTERQKSSHSYYNALYLDADRYVDVALTAAIVFEDIVLPGIDAAFPGVAGPAGSYVNEDLGMRTDWDRGTRARNIVSQRSEIFDADPYLASIRRDPAGELELEYAVADILLAAEEHAPVVCSAGRQRLISRLLENDTLREDFGGPGVAPRSLGPGLAVDLSDYVDLAGIRFNLASWDRLSDLKSDSRIRTYSSAFLAAAEGSSNEPDVLIDRLSDAADAAAAQDDLAGFWTATSRTLDVLSFVPGVGTVAGLGGLVSDAAAARAERQAARLRWHELGPEIQRLQSLHAVEEAMAERSLRRRLELRYGAGAGGQGQGSSPRETA